MHLKSINLHGLTILQFWMVQSRTAIMVSNVTGHCTELCHFLDTGSMFPAKLRFKFDIKIYRFIALDELSVYTLIGMCIAKHPKYYVMHTIHREVVPLPMNIKSLFVMKTNHRQNFQVPKCGFMCHEKVTTHATRKTKYDFWDWDSIASEISVIQMTSNHDLKYLIIFRLCNDLHSVVWAYCGNNGYQMF